MIRLSRSQIQPIGLDIGQDSIKMLQVEVVGGDSLAVVAAARAPLPEEARRDPSLRVPAAVEVIRQLLRRGGFHGRRVITSLPREMVQIKNLRFPAMPPSDLEQAVTFEARSLFAADSQGVQVRSIPVGEVRQGTDLLQEVIAIGIRNDDVDGFVEQLHHAGLMVDSLDVEACALYRCVERFIRRREDEQEVYVLVDIGLRRSQVVIGKGREINCLKPIEIGGQQLCDAVSRKLSITAEEAQALRRRLAGSADAGDGPDRRDPVRQAVFDATRSILEELAREIALCLRYYLVTFRGHRPTKVRLLGGEACDPQIQAVFNAVLSIGVEAGRPLGNVNTSRMKPSDRSGPMSEWALALALGLKRTTGRFGARDGRPRDSMAVAVELPAAVAAAAAPAASGRGQRQEVPSA